MQMENDGVLGFKTVSMIVVLCKSFRTGLVWLGPCRSSEHNKRWVSITVDRFPRLGTSMSMKCVAAFSLSEQVLTLV